MVADNEYHRNYRKTSQHYKEYRKAYDEKYTEEHKEELRQYNLEYYYTHKQELNKKRNAYYHKVNACKKEMKRLGKIDLKIFD